MSVGLKTSELRRSKGSARFKFYVLRRENRKAFYEHRRMKNQPKSKSPTFSRRLRQARQRAGLAQDKLGVLAGLDESLSSARMSRYESGIHEPTGQFVEAVAKVLGVSPAFFYCEDDGLADLILAYSSASPEQREAICQFTEECVKSTGDSEPSE
jgi:transcriptional regulator with XRE-family HTH domain